MRLEIHVAGRYEKISFFHLFHTCHPTIEQKIVLGTLLDCSQYCLKVTKTSPAILELSHDHIGS